MCACVYAHVYAFVCVPDIPAHHVCCHALKFIHVKICAVILMAPQLWERIPLQWR